MRKKYKLKKALIVTDKNIISCGYVEMVETILKSLFISYDIFDNILHRDSATFDPIINKEFVNRTLINQINLVP